MKLGSCTLITSAYRTTTARFEGSHDPIRLAPWAVDLLKPMATRIPDWANHIIPLTARDGRLELFLNDHTKQQAVVSFLEGQGAKLIDAQNNVFELPPGPHGAAKHIKLFTTDAAGTRQHAALPQAIRKLLDGKIL